MHYKIEKDWIYVKDLDRDTAKKLAAVWNEKHEVWRLPNTIGALEDLRQYLKDQQIKAVIEKRTKARVALLSEKTKKDTPGDSRLRPYQRVDVAYLKRLPHFAILNEQRTGKTPTAIVTIKEKGIKQGLIICPAGLCLQWKEEIEKWHGASAAVLTGKPLKQRKELVENFQDGFLIVSYETATRDLEFLLKKTYDVLLLDEAHRLRSVVKGPRKHLDQKGKMSRQAESCLLLGRKAKCRIALTGTPTVRGPYEIYGILKFLYPEKFPGFWQFAERYFEVKQDFLGHWHICDPIRKEELQDVVSLISVNRKRKDVMTWLPKKQYQTIRLDMSEKQRKAYQEVEKTFEYEEDGELLVDAPSVLAQITRLRQITTCPKILDIDDVGAKERFILEWLKDNPNEPVIIFSTFTKYLGRLASVINGRYPFGTIHGGQPLHIRKKVQNEFQEGRFNVLLANIQAAKEGLTLDRAEVSIFVDKSYLPTDNDQASDRMVPVSKERNHAMSIITLACKDTIDEAIEGLLYQRKNLIEVINSGGIQSLKRILKGSITKM